METVVKGVDSEYTVLFQVYTFCLSLWEEKIQSLSWLNKYETMRNQKLHFCYTTSFVMPRSTTVQTLFHPQKTAAQGNPTCIGCWGHDSFLLELPVKLWKSCYKKAEAVSEWRVVVKFFRSPSKDLGITEAAIPQSPAQFPPLLGRLPPRPWPGYGLADGSFHLSLDHWDNILGGVWPFRSLCLNFPDWL